MIHGVIITPLKQIADERGKVMHMLRCDAGVYEKFGEIYFSCVNTGAVKAWKKHKEMTLNLAVPHGQVKFVLYDDRPGSSTRGEVQEIILGPDNYCLLTIPPNIWNGFQGCGDGMSLVANCATLPHDPREAERRDAGDVAIPYTWG